MIESKNINSEKDSLAHLISRLEVLRNENNNLIQSTKELVEERNQARRELCTARTGKRVDTESACRRVTGCSRSDHEPADSNKDPYSLGYAKQRGWDCFENNPYVAPPDLWAIRAAKETAAKLASGK